MNNVQLLPDSLREDLVRVFYEAFRQAPEPFTMRDCESFTDVIMPRVTKELAALQLYRDYCAGLPCASPQFIPSGLGTVDCGSCVPCRARKDTHD